MKYLFIKLLLILFIGLFSACSEEKETIKQHLKIVKVLDLKYIMNRDNNIQYPAEIYPYKNVILAFELSGKIVAFNHRVGDKVKKDEVIAKLDDTIIKSNYNSSKANYERAKLDYNRFKKLYKLHSIAKIDLEKAKQKFDVSKASFEIAKKNLTNTNLIAEFDGILAQKFVEDYARIIAKQQIAVLQNNSKFKVKFFVPESDVLRVKGVLNLKQISQKFDFFVILGNSDKLKYKAKIVDISTNAENITRTYEVTALIDNPKNINILPGMTAKIIVKIKNQEKNSIYIPIHSIFSNNSAKSFVWLVDKDNKVHKKEVKTGEIQKDKIRISFGLSRIDKIVVSGVNFLEENQEIVAYKKLDN